MYDQNSLGSSSEGQSAVIFNSEIFSDLHFFFLQSGCVIVAVLLHYLYLASFGWMLLEGVFLYILIVEVFSTVNVRYLYLFAWGK